MKILVTGGAGFIGSNLVDALLKDDRVSLVRVLDNLATGSEDNLKHLGHLPKFEFLNGDIRSMDDCVRACTGIDLISHQAALGSVPRSIADPLTTNAVNIGGTLNIFTAAKDNGVKRIIYAASSSTYGDHPGLPKVEDRIGKPLSPYAVTKYVNELYAGVYASLYNIEMIGLRYFNIFGPRQNPNGPYAAVIPLFAKSLIDNQAPVINGDGSHSRDFTYVSNAVQANIAALFSQEPEAVNTVYNIACGEQTSLLQLFENLREQAGSSLQPIHGPERNGDVKHSLADISKARRLLKYNPSVSVKEGLRHTYDWYAAQK
ncbi:SDR family oxidoreductase [Terrimonas sp. NA20]|uniref:SDR family oxidoreductase n=1 Tax=Terrimonas ginsenosidimutans TaxID=2908004 RepID=A0ABS9KNR0_9BACT|nr:SDR family oxidoreductase [Terrimonas ginsenosidimutans]